MIIYEYKCKTCGEIHDIPKGQQISRCSQCGGELTRMFSVFGINGFADPDKKKAKQEKQWLITEAEENEKQRESDNVIKEADRELEKMYGELVTTRTPERERHLEKRSTPGTRENQEYREMTGMDQGPAGDE